MCFLKKHGKWKHCLWIFVCIIASIVFAFVIHLCFSEKASNQWWVAKWGAGDILTYAGTVFLGLLTIWQNMRFKEENDKAQVRMENIALKANEIAIISKIIENENRHLTQLTTQFYAFLDFCNTEFIKDEIVEGHKLPSDALLLHIIRKMEIKNKQVSNSYVKLCEELTTYPKKNDKRLYDDWVKFFNLISEYKNLTTQYIRNLQNLDFSDKTDRLETEKLKKEHELIMFHLKFNTKQEKFLNKIIYKGLTLNQIRELYGQSSDEE